MDICAGDGDRCYPGARQKNGDIGFGDHGVEPGEAFSELSPGFEPGEMVEFADQPGIAETAAANLCAQGTDRDGIGRYD